MCLQSFSVFEAVPKVSNPMKAKTVLETLLEWSKDRSDWVQDAVRRIVLHGKPSDQDLTELKQLCMRYHGDKSVLLDPQPLMKHHLPADSDADDSVSIVDINNVEGVNQLAANQKLEFGTTGLTIIYGPNGTGKSGYTRILKKACRTRFAGEILPDVYKMPPAGKARANLTIQNLDGARTEINWEDNDSTISELSSVTVFDRESGSVHLRDKNTVWFRPFGLDIPDDLAKTFKSLQKKFESDIDLIEAQQDSVLSSPTWSESSSFGKVLSKLQYDTNLESLRKLPRFSYEDDVELTRLDEDLAKDRSTVALEQNRLAQDLSSAKNIVQKIINEFSDEQLAKVKILLDLAKTSRETAKIAAEKAFGENLLSGVGDEVWRKLWESARAYSASLYKQVSGFPPSDGDKCVLCQQPIQSEAAVRMANFESYIRGDTEIKAQKAERDLSIFIERLDNISVRVNQVSKAYRYLKKVDPKSAKKLIRFFASAKLRKCQFLTSVKDLKSVTVLPLLQSPTEELNIHTSKLKKYADVLLADENSPEYLQLKQRKAELTDLKKSVKLLKIAETEVARLKRLKLIEDCRRDMNTNLITRLGNKIADDVMSSPRKTLFENEISALANDRIHVEIVRSAGGQGSPRYQVNLANSPKSKVHEVLSEGEQNCVALAAYLTELANSTHKSALVFDDPVSSLDHKWREKVAARLVKEASIRQIVVFTHDLVFVNDLRRKAGESDLKVKEIYLKRSGDAVGFVSEELPWDAAKLKTKAINLRNKAKKARVEYEKNNDEEYRSIVFRLYCSGSN